MNRIAFLVGSALVGGLATSASAGLVAPYTLGTYLGATAPVGQDDFTTESFSSTGYQSVSASDGVSSFILNSALFNVNGFTHIAAFNLGDLVYGSAFARADLTVSNGGTFNINWNWGVLVEHQASWMVVDLGSNTAVAGVVYEDGAATVFGGASANGFGSYSASLSNGNYAIISQMTELGPAAGSSGSASVVWDFAPIPSPGAVALLGLAGLVVRRRR
ncbi:MAG: hypothetical protein RI967_1498 [Planctomycetota bacterium]|jgi:hypothetical protein